MQEIPLLENINTHTDNASETKTSLFTAEDWKREAE